MEDQGRRPAAHDLESLTTLWRERGVSIGRLDGAGSQSLAASDRALTSGMTASASGLRLEENTAATLAREPLELGSLLGRGGMGIVHRAQQRSVRREIAVKRLVDGHDAGALASLLKEAWVGGNLEHPNVTPVHALTELDGSPAVLMKRIEGTSWRQAIREPALLPAGERSDPLAFHLRVLISVCNAIGYAHRRGVLHLDIKPENVMLGEFGEVCVLDWGLAAGHGANAPPWLPSARDISDVSGTPDYMAPEIAMAAGDRISPRTDVYLLGACLHEVVTRRAPHVAETAIQRLFHAYTSAPHAYGTDVPDELAAILHRSLHRDLEQRFESAEALRDALEAFLTHRRGDAIVRDARERIATLEIALAAREDEVGISKRFGAARFALREASDARPGHPDLAPLRARLFGRIAEWALDAGRLELAASYLEQRGEPSPELEERLVSLRDEASARAAKVERLEHLAHEESLEIGARFRRQVTVFYGAVFLFVNLAYDGLERMGIVEIGYPEILLHGASAALFFVGYVTWQRRVMFANHANAALYTVAFITFAMIMCFWISAATLGIPFRTALSMSSVFYLLAGGAVTVLLSARFFMSPVVAAIGMIGAAIRPDLAWIMVGLGGGGALAVVGLSWPSAPAGSAR